MSDHETAAAREPSDGTNVGARPATPCICTLLAAAVFLSFANACGGRTYWSPQPLLRHAITTKNPATQKAFDLGLSLIYGFQFRAAEQAFAQAASADPAAPMPYWGMVIAAGPNYNKPDMSRQDERLVAYGLSHAASLRATGTASERGYIDAVTARFSAGQTQANAQAQYIAKMRQEWHRNPNDPDAGTLLAEAIMEQTRWRLWDQSGNVSKTAEESKAILEAVLSRWPEHVGANHLYVHLMEGSASPATALASAVRLATCCKSYGHLLHTPAHVYMRIGDYADALKSVRAATAADEAYMQVEHNTDPNYLSGYALHNLAFGTSAAVAMGDENTALDFVRTARTEATRFPAEPDDPRPEYLNTADQLVALRFGDWSRVLGATKPNSGLHVSVFLWHYARGCAFALTGRPGGARQEFDLMHGEADWFSIGQQYGMPMVPVDMITHLAGLTAEARLADAEGDLDRAIANWRAAVQYQDSLPYMEPPVWYPLRQSLGAELLRNHQATMAAEVFRADLARNPMSPRSLWGLVEALRATATLSKDSVAIQETFNRVWVGKSPPTIAIY